MGTSAREHEPPALTQSHKLTKVCFHFTPRDNRLFSGLRLFRRSSSSLSIINRKPVLIYSIFILHFIFFCLQCQSALISKLEKATPSFTRVDRASGKLCHMSTLELQLCFDSQRQEKKVDCFYTYKLWNLRTYSGQEYQMCISRIH